MIRIIERMPAGTIGVEAVGKVTEDDYRDVLVPAISAAVERNDVRLLYVLGTEFDSYAPGAVWADTKLWAGHLGAWKKVAIVSDADWLEHGAKVFGCLARSECSRPTTSTTPRSGSRDSMTMTTTTESARGQGPAQSLVPDPQARVEQASCVP